MVAVAAAELNEIVGELRQLLVRVDAILDDTLPPQAEAEATAARGQLVGMIEDALDLIEVDEAFSEAGGERVSWEDFRRKLPPQQP